MLTAYYDLSASPPTYDIVAFLCAVEAYRLRCGARSITIEVLPGPAEGFRRDNFWPFNAADRRHMLHCVAVPMAKMLPTVADVRVRTERPMQRPAMPALGYQASLYGLRVQLRTMRDGIRPLRPRLALTAPRVAQPLVTITLREAAHWPQRNSNVAAWVVAAKAIETRGYNVLVLRDTLHADEPLDGISTFALASSDLEWRATLYRAAAANLFVNNGPAWFAMALDAPVLMMKPTVENLMRTCSAEYFRDCGVAPGQQIPGAPAYQRIVWAEDDEAGAILSAFDDYMTRRT